MVWEGGLLEGSERRSAEVGVAFALHHSGTVPAPYEGRVACGAVPVGSRAVWPGWAVCATGRRPGVRRAAYRYTPYKTH